MNVWTDHLLRSLSSYPLVRYVTNLWRLIWTSPYSYSPLYFVMMQRLRGLKSTILGQDTNKSHIAHELEEGSVPIDAEAACRSCADPCDAGHDEYPSKFDVDMETRMLGSVKPYRRQVVISTGKEDWAREVTDVKGTLAAYLGSVHTTKPSRGTHAGIGSPPKHVDGVFAAENGGRLSVLNGSHATLSDDQDQETVLIFPDYTLVTGVSASEAAAQALYDAALSPSALPGHLTGDMHTWVIPYSCVILLCSHKRRDNRCSIAAKTLEHCFCHALSSAGWQADTRLEDPTALMGSDPLEAFTGTAEEKEAHVKEQLKSLRTEKRALVLKNSHTGGHRYAGNCIIYTPAGQGVWYGRVTPHEVDMIVKTTLEGGKVLPSLLRGGVNIAKPGCHSLHEW
ncbi:Sucrase/ferredoxin-like-domain-containing protein [Schizophyllum amplum]|uniref:Sucrase/ferredoxin-like-domain-containing protein n=1 Tax=Schizophyllum amplum TaxID=97359 RepID=A0A550CU88_9AGAR|nr:Sucrase/ferredoxin-like-domain-containing protein [Auriculariopsis ampla]